MMLEDTQKENLLTARWHALRYSEGSGAASPIVSTGPSTRTAIIPYLLSLILVGLAAPALPARTITLTAEDCDQMAVISSQAPRLSWAIHAYSPGVYNSQAHFYWYAEKTILMRFPIADVIPKGQRITRAELTIAPYYISGVPEIHVRRVLAEWGNGVCHQYRMVQPQKVEWTQPGGRGAATDRANKNSAVIKIAKPVEQTADLTEDVELWYTGAAVNRGWILTQENAAAVPFLPPPYSQHEGSARQWKLQITFEPK